MNKSFYFFLVCILVPSVLFAQAEVVQPSAGQKLIGMVPMFLIVFFIFYFLVIKPQNQKMKEQQDLHTNMQKGDQVITSSGMVGKVVKIDEETISLEIANNVKVKFEKDHITKKYKNESTASK